MSKRAEQRALEAYPKFLEYYPHVPSSTCGPNGFTPTIKDHNAFARQLFQEGYEQAEKDIIALVKQYLKKGERCMEQKGESQIYAFWDGFHNCAENILRELEEKR